MNDRMIHVCMYVVALLPAYLRCEPACAGLRTYSAPAAAAATDNDSNLYELLHLFGSCSTLDLLRAFR